MATLLLINGPPGVGKSTLAAALLREHPEARCVEVDRLRMLIDGWQTDESSKLVARDLALGAIAESLDEGRDVLVPQFLGRPDFVARLAGAATGAGARFVHAVLTAEPDLVAARFARRRADLAAAGQAHPQDEVGEIDEAIAAATAQLAEHTDVVLLDAAAPDLVAQLAALCRTGGSSR